MTGNDQARRKDGRNGERNAFSSPDSVAVTSCAFQSADGDFLEADFRMEDLLEDSLADGGIEETPVLSFAVSPSDAGQRLDQFTAEKAGLTRSAAVRLIGEGAVTVNQIPSEKKSKLRAEDRVEVRLPKPEPAKAIPEDIPLDVVYEDDDVIVINKPVGMVVHPAPGNTQGTLVNALLFHCGASLSGVGGVIRPGIVHRIDKDTGGLLVVAKNDAAHLFLAEQLKEHRIRRIYYAIVIGNVKEDAGCVDAPIGRNPNDRKKMAVIRNASVPSRSAVTHWRVLARAEADGQRFSLLRCELETGRTHQIRVHMASIGHPLLGDPVYGGDKTRFGARHRNLLPAGQCLHACELTFVHPKTGERMQFHCAPSEQMQRVIDLLFPGTVI